MAHSPDRSRDPRRKRMSRNSMSGQSGKLAPEPRPMRRQKTRTMSRLRNASCYQPIWPGCDDPENLEMKRPVPVSSSYSRLALSSAFKTSSLCGIGQRLDPDQYTKNPPWCSGLKVLRYNALPESPILDHFDGNLIISRPGRGGNPLPRVYSRIILPVRMLSGFHSASGDPFRTNQIHGW